MATFPLRVSTFIKDHAAGSPLDVVILPTIVTLLLTQIPLEPEALAICQLAMRHYLSQKTN